MIRFVEETGSTNADLAQQLRAGERIPEGEWLVAKRQNAGKGRQGREWFDGAGNFMGSTIVRIADGGPAASTLNLPVSLALYSAVSDFLAAPEDLMLKWPNDILLRQAKLSGILMERVGDSVIVGIGVNLAASPRLDERKTIALSDIGPTPKLAVFAEKLAQRFAEELMRWRSYGVEPLINRWLAGAHRVGTPLSIHDVDGSRIEGAFDGLEPDGALKLRLADGTRRVIHTGDVMLSQGS